MVINSRVCEKNEAECYEQQEFQLFHRDDFNLLILIPVQNNRRNDIFSLDLLLKPSDHEIM